MQNKKLIIIFAIVALIGFIDASYLTALHYLHISPPCSITNGCDSVTTSTYSRIGPIPIALLGALYYITLFMLSAYALTMRSLKHLSFAVKLSPLGFLASIYLVYLQLFVILALCQYCILSAITSTLLFVLGIFIWKKSKAALVIKEL